MICLRLAVVTGMAMLVVTTIQRPASAGPTYSYATFDVPGAAGTSVEGLSPNGSSGVGYSTNSRGVNGGFLVSGAATTSLSVPGSVSTMALGVNDSGTVVGVDVTTGSRKNTTVDNGFLYANGQYSTISIAGASGVVAVGVNDSGQVSGTYTDALGLSHGFLDTNGAITTLDDPNALAGYTFGRGLNDLGQVVGYYYDASIGLHGFIYSGGVYRTLDAPAGVTGTMALGINDAGTIVGQALDSSGIAQGFVNSGGAFSPLVDPSGVGGTGPQGISNAGVIVGDYVNGAGGEDGFIATPLSVPEPFSLILAAQGAGAAALGRFLGNFLRRSSRGEPNP